MDERAKIDAKTKECIYLRSPREEIGYRLWDPVNKKIIRSWDAVFFEDETLEDAKEEKPKLKVVRNFDSNSPPMVHDNLVEDAIDESVEDDTNEDHVSSFNSD